MLYCEVYRCLSLRVVICVTFELFQYYNHLFLDFSTNLEIFIIVGHGCICIWRVEMRKCLLRPLFFSKLSFWWILVKLQYLHHPDITYLWKEKYFEVLKITRQSEGELQKGLHPLFRGESMLAFLQFNGLCFFHKLLISCSIMFVLRGDNWIHCVHSP